MEGVRGQSGQGDEAVRAASEIVRRFGGFIRAVIRFKAGSMLDEEDLFQEFFLTLVRKPVPPDVRSIKSFLYRAVTNHVIDTIRAHRNYQRLLGKYVNQAGISIHNADAGNAFMEEERKRTIAYCVRHLREKQARAFVLRYQDSCSIPEIAEKMCVDRRTVSRYLSECLRTLRKTPAVE